MSSPAQSDCLDENDVAELAAGLVAPERAAALHAHLDVCQTCRAQVSEAARQLGEDGSTADPTANLRGPAGLKRRIPKAPQAPLARGERFGRYVVLEQLGEGGMGVVMAAFDPMLERRIALKLLHGYSNRDREQKARLIREAQAMARLSHHNVITVHDVGEVDGRPYIAMELVEGTTLRGWLREKPRSVRETLQRFLAAGRGLEAAHQAGLVHRDFKPANVLVGADGRVRVTDFGLARQLQQEPPSDGSEGSGETWTSSSDQITQAGTVIGTPAYMAPEQIDGHTPTARTDQFSFCVALWEGLYGIRPFLGRDLEEVREQILDRRYTFLEHPPRLPGHVVQVLRRGLHPDPDERFASMADLLGELSRDPAAKYRRGALVAAGVLVLGGAALGANLWGNRAVRQCAGGQEKVAKVWNPQREAALAQAFAATSVPFATDSFQAVKRRFDAWTAGWVAMHTDACLATFRRGEQSEEVLALRYECLEAQRTTLDATLRVLGQVDKGSMAGALTVAASLPAVGACGDVPQLLGRPRLPAEPAKRAAIASAVAEVAEASALIDGGRYQDAREVATAAAAKLRALDHPPALAEALRVLGKAESLLRNLTVANETLWEAALVAWVAGDRLIAAQSWSRLVWVTSEQARWEEAERVWRLAEGGLASVRADGLERAELLGAAASFRQAQGRGADSVQLAEQSLEILERLLPPGDIRMVHALNTYAVTLSSLGRVEEALAVLDRAAAMVRETAGPDHPMHAMILSNACPLYTSLGRLEDALVACNRALDIRQRISGRDSPEVASTHNNLGGILDRMGQSDQALVHYRQALALREGSLGSDHPRTALARNNVGSALQELGRLDEAEPYLRQAAEGFARAKDPREHSPLRLLGDLMAARGRHADAVAWYRKALERLGDQGLARDKGLVLRALGEALLREGKAREGRAQLEAAVAAFESAPAEPKEQGRAYAALAIHLKDADPVRARRLAGQAQALLRAAGPLGQPDLAALAQAFGGALPDAP